MSIPIETDHSPRSWPISRVLRSFFRGILEACVAVTLAFVIITGMLWFAGSSWLTLLTPPTCPTDPGYDAEFERAIPSLPPGLDLIDRRLFHSSYTTISSRQRPSDVVPNDRIGDV